MGSLKRAAAGVALVASLVVGCGGTTTEATFELVAPPVAAEVIADGAPVVLDVRTPEEYAEGHLADAVLIDFYDTDFADQLNELDKDATYVVYCRSGNRSQGAINTMRELGFTDVFEVAGGIQAWLEAGLNVGE
ncbi:MAG: rhodanese-like domain-containing protein [Acidimicrobiia bacterium]|nr:rhodanese-like domain-containing protein [Acidimicrobiia bacterium]